MKNNYRRLRLGKASESVRGEDVKSWRVCTVKGKGMSHPSVVKGEN
jgi:hypothetical protein